FRALEKERQEKGWPELICCPLDEVISSQKEFGAKTYQAVRDGGIRTYITKNPVAADAADYRAAIDIWCSQPFSVPYEKIIAQDRYEYWSYPNHNAGEVKDRRVMCKGGRMTYGFGFWRSGYTTLIPWHWAWTPRDDQFDYLRGRRSGCGQRLDDNGEVIPSVYWQCFREGRDDARYIYTLQQAVWEREGTGNPECRRLVSTGKALLQRMWQDIKVQEKYLATGMWPSAEFNARRWRMAQATTALLRHPAVRQGAAPSVLVEDTGAATATADADFITTAIAEGKLAATDLSGDFSQWVNVTTEGKVSVTPEAGKDGKSGLRWQVKVNHKPAGDEESDAYPIGWPRVYRTLTPAERDLSASDYLLFTMRFDSNRDEVADDTTPVGFTIHSNKFYEVTRDLGGRQRVWLPVLFPIRELIDLVGQGEEPWHAINKVQFFITERHYAHDTSFTFDVAEVKLLRFKAPMIRDIEAPRYAMLPRAVLPVALTLMGTGSVKPGTHSLTATLSPLGEQPAKAGIAHSQDLAAGSTLLLDTAGLRPGAYSLKVGIQTADGTDCGSKTQTIQFLPGPLVEN
ncbi:MAG: hypothetical protein HN849_16760, partial [Victivallales bacterium]|nr:hypothetical protein [Victivallales bacterium]